MYRLPLCIWLLGTQKSQRPRIVVVQYRYRGYLLKNRETDGYAHVCFAAHK